MSSYTSAGRKRARRTSFAPHSRSWGGKGLQGPKADKGPGKRQVAADAALASILELFESGELPARIAETVIARAEGVSPSANWSLGNQLLCLLAGTTDARGYRQWGEVGRHVVKGAKAIYILGPVKRKRTEKDAETGETRDSFYVAGFTAIPVFRIEDTDGPPVATYADYRPAEWPPLYDVAEALGVTVTYGPGDGRFRGCYSPGAERITLCTEDACTFFHELAHAAHARVLRERGEDVKGGQVPSQEIVAEVVSATLCKLYGLDGYLWHGAEYVTRYANGGNPARAAIKVLGDVQACLYLILETAIETGAAVPVTVAA